MVINEDLIELIQESKVDVEKAKLYFLCIYHEIDTSFVMLTQKDITTINLLKVVERDYKTSTIKWNIPLYSNNEIDNNWGWLKEWMKAFGNINPERKGVYATCVQRMKAFFAKYPQYRKEDVFLARDMYLRTVTNPQFVTTSHKFIFDGAGAMKNSTLLGYCEKIGEKLESYDGSKGRML